MPAGRERPGSNPQSSRPETTAIGSPLAPTPSHLQAVNPGMGMRLQWFLLPAIC